MSSIVYEESQEVLDENEELSSFEEEEVIEEAPEEEKPEIVIPDKFKGKDLEDVVKSYQELESEFGRRNNEVGELRKLTDELLQLKLNEGKSEEKPAPQMDVDTLLENPEEAISNVVDNNPRLKQLEEQLLQAEREKGRTEFEAKYPDAYEKAQSAEFQSFVTSSPIIQKMFQEAHANYDYASAGQLMDMYDQLHGKQVEEAVQGQENKRQEALKAASVEKGSPGVQKRKVYRRSELIQLRLTNPAKYDAMADDIRKAYAEGRVK
jgi:hypothetical protein